MTQRLFDPNEDVSWMDDGECRGLYGLMHPHRGDATADSKALCAICPVRAECLEYALRHSEMFGIWGGTSERERRRMRRLRAAKPRTMNPRLCGTDSGYRQHYRYDQTPCDLCREAHRVYQQGTRRSRAVAS
jgi:WhiB family redox-sensing transcriptional regulator